MNPVFARRFLKTSVLSLALLCGGAVSCIGSAGGGDLPKELEQYVVDSTPAEMLPLNINFDDKVSLIGVEVKAADEVVAGDRVRLKMYWRVHVPLDDPQWKLFTHVLDSKGRRLLNIDNVGPLRRFRNGNQAWPPGRWENGKIYVDTQSFSVPRKTKTKTLRVTVGIWKGSKRLKLKGGPSLDKDRGLVATLNVGPPKKLPPVPVLEPMHLSKGVTLKIDGKLDEAVWKDAADTGAFVNVATGQADAKSKIQGSAKLLWDDDALYVGFDVQDEDLRGKFGAKEKDPHLWTQDCVELMIDPDGNADNKNYYEIQVGPQNLVFDSHFDAYNQPVKRPDGPFGHQDWSAHLQSAVQLHGTLNNSQDKDKGYTVELRIPWVSFDKAKRVPPRAQQTWRVNLYAMQNNSGLAWSPILGEGNFHKASRFGKVRWLTDDDQRLSVRKAKAKALAQSRAKDRAEALADAKTAGSSVGTQPAAAKKTGH